ncbi:MAG: hypothetical protein ABIV63_05410, partial [Caldimonas sp.]
MTPTTPVILAIPPTAATTGIDPASMAAFLDTKLVDQVGIDPANAQRVDLLQGVSQVARDRLSRRWVRTQARQGEAKARRVYYMSMEFLMGRTLGNALAALDLREP